MGVRVRIDQGQVVAVVGALSLAATRRAAEKLRDRARVNISSAGRVDTGAMMEQINLTDVTADPLRPTIRVSADTKEAAFNEWGTRDHGPTTAKFMVFKPKGSGAFVFAKHVKGIEAIHFMARAKALAAPFDYAG